MLTLDELVFSFSFTKNLIALSQLAFFLFLVTLYTISFHTLHTPKVFIIIIIIIIVGKSKLLILLFLT